MAATKTDLAEAIQTLAEANVMIKENEKTIKDQEEVIKRNSEKIAHQEKSTTDLEEENRKKLAEYKEKEVQREKNRENSEQSIKDEREKLEIERTQIQEERDALALEKAEAQKAKEENQRIKNENEKESAELQSKIVEKDRLSELRKGELKNISLEKDAIIEERKKLEVLQKNVETTVEENKVVLARIEQAQKDAEVNSKNANEALAKAQEEKTHAVYEQSAATFVKNEALHLVQVFRQAIRTYTQVNGTSIQIEELTDDHKKFIAKDMIAQCEVPVKPEEIFEDLVIVREEETDEDIPGPIGGEVVVATTIPAQTPTGEATPDQWADTMEKLIDKEFYQQFTKDELAENAMKHYNLELDTTEKHEVLVEKIITHIQSLPTGEEEVK